MAGKEGAQPKYTPEQEEEFRKTRALEIAMLIQGGAIFLDDGLLKLTDSQTEDIKREKQREETQGRFNKFIEDFAPIEETFLPFRREVFKDFTNLERIKSARYNEGLRKREEIDNLHKTIATVIPRLIEEEEYRREFKQIEGSISKHGDVITMMGESYIKGLELTGQQIELRYQRLRQQRPTSTQQ